MSGEDQVFARAAASGYAMVGVSARAWLVDEATGVPSGPAPEAEHHLLRTLMGRELLGGTEPVWMPCEDGQDEIVSLVTVLPDDADAVDQARSAVDGVAVEAESHADGMPDSGYPLGCCIPADEDGWSR